MDDAVVCICNPLNGKLFLVRMQFPPNSKTMHVVLSKKSTVLTHPVSENQKPTSPLNAFTPETHEIGARPVDTHPPYAHCSRRRKQRLSTFTWAEGKDIELSKY
ncbi:BnaA07g28410D [Brassica napus]|uniref:BnaA07g28410D protein n=1 Tax=Brassica napus TaxID=3708 RepID=A0A078HN27_BRANA|nr:BnaA07g28410D [Brassica napus]